MITHEQIPDFYDWLSRYVQVSNWLSYRDRLLCTGVAPSGHSVQPRLTASDEAAITPTCLSTNNPAAMPSGTAASKAPTESPPNDNPAVAKPKTGKLR